MLVVMLLAACATQPPSEPVTSRPVPTPAQSATSATPTPNPTPTPDPRQWVQRENAQPGTRGWTLEKGAAAADQVAGFADRTSAAAGEKVTLRVTATVPTWTAEVYRLGYYGGAGGRLVWRSDPQTGVAQPPPRVDAGNAVTAAHWAPSLALDTAGWPPGSYLIKLVIPSGAGRYIPLTIRSDAYAGRVVLLAATTTYQAYNTWGGYSLYKGPHGFEDRARRVSYDRPYDHNGARHATGYEQNIVLLAERLGLDLAYATVDDLERGPAAFAGARGLVSPGHDEYWSPAMRATVEALRDSGTNVAFLGANALYWRVRLSASPLGERRVVEGYKSAAEDPVKDGSATAQWRQSPGANPESSLVGMLYECFPAEGALVVHDPAFFLFAGTGATRGSSYPGLIGTEIDRAYPGYGTPASLRVVAHSLVQCGNVGRTYADMTYYTAPSGAGVLAVGTMNWVYALQADPQPGTGQTPATLAFATKVTENLLTAMAAGPMGASNPATSNLAEIAPNPSTRTGTGGPVG